MGNVSFINNIILIKRIRKTKTVLKVINYYIIINTFCVVCTARLKRIDVCQKNEFIKYRF